MNTLTKRMLFYGVILFLIGSLLLLLLLNYSIIYAFIGGCFGAYLINKLPWVLEKMAELELKLLSKAPVIWRTLVRLLFNTLALIVFSFAVFVLVNYSIQNSICASCKFSVYAPSSNDPLYDCNDGPIAEQYNVTIKTDPNTKDQFLVQDVFINPCPSKLKSILKKNATVNIVVELTERHVSSTTKGLLLKELIYSPQNTTSKNVDIPLENGYHIVGNSLCSQNICPKINVTLHNFPKDAFYAAKASFDVKFTPYIDIENVSWSIYPTEEHVVFAYIPEPLQYIRPLILPFVGISSLSQLLVALLGLAGTMILTPIMKPIMMEQLQKAFRIWFQHTRLVKPEKSNSLNSPQSKAKLIISAKGEEKEIDVNRENKDG